MGITAIELAQCFDDYAAGMVLYARQWAGASLAEDMVQEAFIRLAAQQKMPTNPRGWLLVTVRHAAVDAAKAARRRSARDTLLARGDLFTEPSTSDGRLDQMEVTAALADLPPMHREIVVLRIWNGATFDEIASLTHTPLSTVYGYYRTALETLRKKWGSPCR